VRVFLDAGVVISAGELRTPKASGTSAQRRREHELARAAHLGSLALLCDDHEFFFTPFVELEVYPLPEFERQDLPLAVRQGFLLQASPVDASLEQIVVRAREVGRETGVAGMDALHLAAAELARCDVLATTERAGKPLHRSRRVRVVDVRTLVGEPH
jgi:predicted nucleic acid-binding protein